MLINLVVLTALVYLTVVQTMAGWLAQLRKGEAVSLFPARSGRPVPAWAQIAFMLVGLLLAIPLIYFTWVPLPVALPPAVASMLDVLGLAVFLAGFGLIVWGRRALGANWGVSTSREVKLRPDHQLVQGGPFAHIRHPMYAGWWLALVGLLLIYWTWLILLMLVMSLASFYKRARLEETVLAERFGDDWRAYVARTGFMFPRWRGARG